VNNKPSAWDRTLSVVKKFGVFCGTQNAHYRVHRSRPLLHILGLIKPVHALPSYFLKTHFNIISDTLGALFPSGFPTKPFMHIATTYMPHAPPISSFTSPQKYLITSTNHEALHYATSHFLKTHFNIIFLKDTF